MERFQSKKEQLNEEEKKEKQLDKETEEKEILVEFISTPINSNEQHLFEGKYKIYPDPENPQKIKCELVHGSLKDLGEASKEDIKNFKEKFESETPTNISEEIKKESEKTSESKE